MRIHPIFHISLLEKAPENAKREPVYIDKEIQEPLYNVDHIIEHKLIQNKRHYLIY